MLTVGRLARRHGLARSTLLYYARIGLLVPSGRSPSNYRAYDPQDEARLAEICRYRALGLGLREIACLLDEGSRTAALLTARLEALNDEIARCREQQRVILGLLRGRSSERLVRTMDKRRWVALLRASGLDDDDMAQWHAEFERRAPAAHQDFLQSLGIDEDDVRAIRTRARARARRS